MRRRARPLPVAAPLHCGGGFGGWRPGLSRSDADARRAVQDVGMRRRRRGRCTRATVRLSVAPCREREHRPHVRRRHGAARAGSALCPEKRRGVDVGVRDRVSVVDRGAGAAPRRLLERCSRAGLWDELRGLVVVAAVCWVL